MTLSAHAAVPQLLTSLQRAGWGDLAGREWQGVRTTLHALAAQLPHKAGQGWTTAHQVAEAAGLTERWVRRCMQVLEDLGVIDWHRGGVVDGVPQPSFVRIVKRVLVDLIRAARPIREAADRAYRAATNARIARLRNVRGQRSRRSAHAELSASPSTPTGEVPPSNLPERSDMRPMHPGVDAPICEHGGDGRRNSKTGTPMCPMCRAAEAAKAPEPVASKPRARRAEPIMLDFAALAAGERAEDDA